MKQTLASFSLLLAGGALLAAAEPNPKIAVAGVEAAPLLVKQYAGESRAVPQKVTPPVTVAPSTVIEGVWEGTWFGPMNKKWQPTRITISRMVDGKLCAAWLFTETGEKPYALCTNVEFNGRHLKLVFDADAPKRPNAGASFATVEGELDAEGKLSAHYQRLMWGRKQNIPFVLDRTAAAAPSGVTAPTVARSQPEPIQAPPASTSLDQLLHALDVQLAEHLDQTHLFIVLAKDDLEQAVPFSGNGTNHDYNLKNAKTAQQFKAAGISYLLQTTVHDFQDQAIDLSRQALNTQSGNYNNQSSSRFLRNNNGPLPSRRSSGAGVDRESSGNWQQQQTYGSAQINRGQIVRVTVGMQLIDAATGEKVDQTTHSFWTNRMYSAVASGSNVLSQTDLFEAAARSMAERAAGFASEVVFPITVLDRTNKLVTINRGAHAGLRIGQIYNVFVDGKEMIDPKSGRVLGRDMERVGRVAIKDLRPEFSKATILEDNGIAVGGRLRWAQP